MAFGQAAGQIVPDGPDLFHLRFVKVRGVGFGRHFHGLQVEQQLQHLDLQIRQADALRHMVHFLKDLLGQLPAVEHPGIPSQLEFFQQGGGGHRKILHLLGQRGFGKVEIQPHGDAMVVAGREHEPPLMGQAAVQFQIPRFAVGQRIFRGQVLHPAFPAVIEDKQLLPGGKAGIEGCHVEVVETQHGTREQLIGGHGAVAGLIAELPDAAAAALCQQHGTLLHELGLCDHGSPPFELAAANLAGCKKCRPAAFIITDAGGFS